MRDPSGPPEPFRRSFWRSPIRGPWLTSVFGLTLLVSLPLVILTGLLDFIAYAPQFHDNHIFGGSLAFNLLMGRSWPPTPEDIAIAAAVCRELGLGDLIDRMPAGLVEQVGETGWQLSHGERSRVFLARALLQRADLVLVDESLAALDPVNLALALACIETRAPAAIVIAHP